LDDVKYAHPLQEAAGVPILSLYMSHNPAQTSQVPVVHFEDSKVAMGGVNGMHQRRDSIQDTKGPLARPFLLHMHQVMSPGLHRVPLQT
jgi:hypothetical protein